MKIRTKLIISNILVIVIPLGIAIGMLAIFVNGPGAKYWETIEDLYDDYNGVYSAQALLQTYENPHDLKNVKKELTNIGYRFSIIKNHKQTFSNLTKEDIVQAKKIAGDLYEKGVAFSVNKGDVSVVYEVDNDNGVRYDLMAIKTQKVDGDSYLKVYISLYIGFIICVLLAAVVLVNIVLTWVISRSILKPLKKLSVGSELIRAGNLDFEMAADRKDELGVAINDFDEMRKHLKTSVTERLMYEQYRKELMIGISHDLRTPLTSIKGYVEGLRDGIAKTAEMKLKYYEAIETSIDSLEHLVSTLSEFTKDGMINYEFRFENIELNRFYESAVEELRHKYIKDGVKIEFIKSDTKLYADIDPKEIERININLIENSIKYREGSCSEINISLDTHDGDAVIKIADDGPGVREENLNRIFECFYRADAARTSPAKGSGIGLAIVKQIVEKHGGTVHAENDNGLAIIITIPLKGGHKDEKNSGR